MQMTKETEDNLKNNIDLTIDFIAKSLDVVRRLLKNIDTAQDFLKKRNISNSEKVFAEAISILEYRMLIGLIYLDLASATKAHLILTSKYEKLFSLKQIIVTITEGYKQIYHFIRLNENGDLITRDRNKSFWYKDIKKIIEESQYQLIDEYNHLSQKLDIYYDENLTSIKSIRDLFVHYDKKASMLYDSTVNLDVDGIFRKMSPFLGILNDMFHFTGKMAIVLNHTENKKHEDFINQTNQTLMELEDKVASKKTETNSKQINELLETMRKNRIELIEKIKNPNS